MTAEKWVAAILIALLIPIIVVAAVIALGLAVGYVLILGIWNLTQLMLGMPLIPFGSPSVPVAHK